MAEVWSTPLTLRAGPISPQRAEVGPTNRPGPNKQVSESVGGHMGTIRVGYMASMYQGLVGLLADVRLDQGLRIEGIDVPFVLSVPLPCEVSVYPQAELVADLVVVVSAAQGVIQGADWGATRSGFVNAATVVPLLPWTAAVTIHNEAAATGTWQDAAAAAIGVFSGYKPRPRGAVSLLVGGAASMVTQHIST